MAAVHLVRGHYAHDDYWLLITYTLQFWLNSENDSDVNANDSSNNPIRDNDTHDFRNDYSAWHHANWAHYDYTDRCVSKVFHLAYNIQNLHI